MKQSSASVSATATSPVVLRSRQTALCRWIETQDRSVTEIAADLSVHRVTLHGYISGRSMPRPAVAARIEALTLGAVTIGDLARGFAEFRA